MTSRPHDALFKEAFSDLANARGELSSVLPPDIVALIDWDTLRLEPGSFVDEALRETLTHLLFSVRMQGRESLIDVVDDAEREALGPRVPLPDHRRRSPRVSNDALDARAMPSTAKLMLAALRDVRDADDVIAALTTWARWIEELGDTREGRADRTRADPTGRSRRRARGEARGRAEMLIKLLALRFKSVAPDVAQQVRSADVAMLDRWAERVLTATSILALRTDRVGRSRRSGRPRGDPSPHCRTAPAPAG